MQAQYVSCSGLSTSWTQGVNTCQAITIEIGAKYLAEWENQVLSSRLGNKTFLFQSTRQHLIFPFGQILGADLDGDSLTSVTNPRRSCSCG
jgi:hypothetical protein